MNTKIIVLIVIIAVIVAGGIFFLARGPKVPEGSSPSASEPETLTSLSESDTVPTLERELQTTELEGLDKEFSDIESEINAALTE